MLFKYSNKANQRNSKTYKNSFNDTFLIWKYVLLQNKEIVNEVIRSNATC